MDSQPDRDHPITDLVPVDQVQALFPGAVLYDDTPLWLAWEMAKDEWLKELPTVNTRHSYASDLKLFFEWVQIEPWDISTAHAIRFKAHLADLGRADTTINRKLASLSSFYNFVRKRFIFHKDGRDISLWPSDRANPFDAVHRLRASPYGRTRFPTSDELKTLLESIDTKSLMGQRDFALIYCYATTCRRSSEIRNLRWGDLQVRDDGDYTYTYRYKGGDIRRGVLNHLAYTAICAYLRADGRPPEDMRAGDYIFIPLYPERANRFPGQARPEDDNHPLSASTAAGILKKYCRRAGIDPAKAHLHALRHAGARYRAEQMKATGGVDYMELMQLLGHASLAITQIYAQTILEEPEDPGGQAAAEGLLPKKRRRRRGADAVGAIPRDCPVQETYLE